MLQIRLLASIRCANVVRYREAFALGENASPLLHPHCAAAPACCGRYGLLTHCQQPSPVPVVRADTSMCIVMEHAPNGDLQSQVDLAARQKLPLTKPQLWSICIQICRGLQALHARNIVHRDLKLANVFRAEGDIVKARHSYLSFGSCTRTVYMECTCGQAPHIAAAAWKAPCRP